ncbi:hypothetical protein PIGHUM_02553 [Pigmentiphaga humi]|uniref:DUF4390 domain-containing protein n=1 Tax=Pigmentiphaga humi TaxID=2478468 RepID=A0A3P4B3I6_9BURK|nr:DUF4390 domain-containing protein [Pigmentiphaga humi]VCU70481.1 hypothetical protein PIGHUM_02553 [Pigmentiphaga humi]
MIIRLHRVLILPILVLALTWGGVATAAEPAVQSVSLAERGRDLLLSADVSLDLNNQLEDAVSRGLPLYFSVEVEIRKPRWYWFDEVVLASNQTWRIVYNPLTRQWRVHSGNLALPVGSLAEALSVVRHVRSWRIGERDALQADTAYQGRLRVRFDVSQLSKPFQVNALNSSDWSLATPWTDFDVRLGSAPSPAAPAPVPAPAAVPAGPPLAVQPGLPAVPAIPPSLSGSAANGGAAIGQGLTMPGGQPSSPGGVGLTPPSEGR